MIRVVRKLNTRGAFFRTFCCLYFFISCSGEPVKEVQLPGTSSAYSTLELEILFLVNNYRNSLGHKELLRLDEISREAQFHSEHMALTKEVCHHNFGSRFKALNQKVGAQSMGENVGYGYRTPDAYLQAWITSPDHRKILEGEYTHFGISAREAENKSYVTLIFIAK